MPVTFDPVGDFISVCDGLQAVTLTERDGTEQDIDHALIRAITTKEAAASHGLYRQGDVFIHLPQSEVSGAPELGATITDGEATEWTILATGDHTLNDRWRCVCRNLVVAEQLNTLVRIQVSTVTQDDDGAHEQEWADLMDPVRGRIQRAFSRSNTASTGTAQAEVIRGTHQMESSFTLFIREAVTGGLTTRHRIIDSDGNKYRVIGYRDAERIDKLTEVDLAPWTENYSTGGLGE